MLDDRLPPGQSSLRQAAWAGLQDRHAPSRATLMTTGRRNHAVDLGSVARAVWGPRYNVFVIAAGDLAVFSLGLFPDDAKGQRRTVDLACVSTDSSAVHESAMQRRGARLACTRTASGTRREAALS